LSQTDTHTQTHKPTPVKHTRTLSRGDSGEQFPVFVNFIETDSGGNGEGTGICFLIYAESYNK